MSMCFYRYFCMMVVILLSAVSQSLLAINCNESRQLAAQYLNRHFTYRQWSDELSQKTFDQLIKNWDPGKVYFYDQDVQSLQQKYANNIDDLLQKSDCAFVKEIVDLYTKRFLEAQKIIEKQILANHDFTKDEYLDLDRKKLQFAKTSEEISERWRQRIKYQLLQLKTSLKGDVKKAQEKLKKRYDLALKRHNETTMDQVYGVFLNSFALALDPHSEYMPPEQSEDFRISTSLSLEGIGASLRSEDGFTRIQSLVPGGAAAKTGKFKADDKIIAVAQGKDTPVDVIDMDLRDVVKLIRGAGGTEVRLTIVREKDGKAETMIIPVIREKVQLTDRAAKSKVVVAVVRDEKKMPILSQKIGVLTLPSFYRDFDGMRRKQNNFRSSAIDMVGELQKLEKEKIDALIVDLRNNGGGSLDESVLTAGLFFDKGPVVQIRGYESSGSTKDAQNVEIKNDQDGQTLYKGPLVVLINRQSASASEIFAGAIQDYKRGLIVGDSHTFGKGTVQSLDEIEKLGAMKVTISKFYRPSGSSTQLKGVQSDIVLPSIADELEIGEKHYDNVLPWEQIQPASFELKDMVTSTLPELKDRNKNRVEQNEDFKKLQEEIQKFKSNESERTRISLKEIKEGEDKKSGKEDLASKEEDEPEDGMDTKLEDDFFLQETVLIASDYVRKLQNQKLVGKTDIPQVEQAKLAKAKKETSQKIATKESQKKKSGVVGKLPDEKEKKLPEGAIVSPQSK